MSIAQDCLRGDQDACRRLYIFHWLLPRLERELAQLLKTLVVVTPVRPPLPGPDPLPFADLWILRERNLLRTLLGDPHPQPNRPPPVASSGVFHPANRLQASLVLRDGLLRTVRALDQEIAQLRQQGQLGR